MKKRKRLLDEMTEGNIENPYLRDLVKALKSNAVTNPLSLAPETAQIITGKWHHHSDHTDYTAHNDTAPPHGDYCD